MLSNLIPFACRFGNCLGLNKLSKPFQNKLSTRSRASRTTSYALDCDLRAFRMRRIPRMHSSASSSVSAAVNRRMDRLEIVVKPPVHPRRPISERQILRDRCYVQKGQKEWIQVPFMFIVNEVAAARHVLAPFRDSRQASTSRWSRTSPPGEML